ncbi:MAG: type II toxin-antitoxin system PemK/MazF family toxin, partial [bacterium]
MRRKEIFWADLGPEAGRRPVCIVTRDAAIEVLDRVTCAPITRTIRDI